MRRTSRMLSLPSRRPLQISRSASEIVLDLQRVSPQNAKCTDEAVAVDDRDAVEPEEHLDIELLRPVDDRRRLSESSGFLAREVPAHRPPGHRPRVDLDGWCTFRKHALSDVGEGAVRVVEISDLVVDEPTDLFEVALRQRLDRILLGRSGWQ